MKGNKLTCVSLCLFLCWMLPVGSKKISFIVSLPEANSGIQMSMVEDAVDDMYFGCNETMAKMVKDKYFQKENKGIFKDVWKKAESCANHNLKNKDTGDEALTKEHMQAICVYTSGYKGFHQIFNDAVRTNRKVYGTSFPFHSLQFWLTSAVKILSENNNCHITYRRSKVVFTGNVNQMIRFGSFTSSSKDPGLSQFGWKTCFKIMTCLGAYLKKYPHLGKKEEADEKEVLIPPYEIFKITGKKKDASVKGLEDCEVVYILQSVGLQSNLNCMLCTKIKTKGFFNFK
ncbi:ecto-ADP-ribosyltransferase 5-like [Epinephelus fuscoguttatus]|uniref:ecto-ADP-ribosyltransferase 5-like n=1 Tax=Epinephelus fuscoguttatus TaxID=293821 RepID=UPI0020D038B8|nr:ecto-ADP-ribosyltransferase 5-like [Epinephelus fuscoguttatus]